MVLHRLLRTVEKMLWKKSIHLTSYPKEIFSVYLEHKNLIESQIHELKISKPFHP